MVLNLLSVSAAYGAMTLVFQRDWAEGLLDFTSIGSVASWIPLIMFVTLFGGVLLPAVLTLLGRRAHTGPRWIPVLHH